MEIALDYAAEAAWHCKVAEEYRTLGTGIGTTKARRSFPAKSVRKHADGGNDDTARKYAKRLVHVHPIEVWDGACLIGRLEPTSPQTN